MTPSNFVSTVLTPDLAWFHAIIPSIPSSDAANVMLCAIPGQESGWENVQQTDGGIARGFYQQQQNNLDDILFNRATDAKAIMICTTLGIQPTGSDVYAMLLSNTKLQVAFARLNLWADPSPLPAVGDESGAWNLYIKCWNPGAPSRERWNLAYSQGLTAIQQGSPTV
jgi:hypothetical protein